MNEHGEEFFRELENATLQHVLSQKTPLILALGGRPTIKNRNQSLLKGHKIVHVTAPRSIVFERIMINGKPAFFPQEEDAFDHFQKLWAKRLPVFEDLAQLTVKNDGTIDGLTDEVLKQLHLTA